MDVQKSIYSLAMLATSALAAYFLFRRNPRERLLSRGPFFIACIFVFVYLAVTELPLALPALFEKAIGHSIWADYEPARIIGVTQSGGTWWLVRWLDPIQLAYSWIVFGGLVWAAVNLGRGRARGWNLAALLVGLLGFVATLFLSFACYPLCL